MEKAVSCDTRNPETATLVNLPSRDWPMLVERLPRYRSDRFSTIYDVGRPRLRKATDVTQDFTGQNA